MEEDFNRDYKLMRKLVVQGQVTSVEAKQWMHDWMARRQLLFEGRLKRFGTNANRDLKFFQDTGEIDD